MDIIIHYLKIKRISV